MKKIIFVNSHPIQYFAPLYKFLNLQGIETDVWYGSDESIKGGLDKQFGTQIKWDIPLLEGYKSHFFKNYSRRPSHFNGFFGLMNFGMITQLVKVPKSLIIVHGWHYFSNLSVLIFARMLGHKVCIRCEMPLNQELLKKGWAQSFKRFCLKWLLFPRIDYFLNIGTQNKLFYKHLGVSEEKIVFCPYSVDNERFQGDAINLRDKVRDIKSKLGIAPGDKVILYSGKYIDKKRPLDLLKAYIQLNKKDCWLIMVGEGALRGEMEHLIASNKLEKVVLTGFINQSKIAEYYSICDLFVMCSEIGETWGLSVNEAMNFDKPVVISDATGSSYDLVNDGDNGYVYETGDIISLSKRIHNVLYDRALSWKNNSRSIVDIYSYTTIAENLRLLVSENSK